MLGGGGADEEMCGCPPGSPQFTHRIWGQRREREGESAGAETPGEGLALTAQQRRIMPGGAGLFDRFKCNVWLRLRQGGST